MKDRAQDDYYLRTLREQGENSQVKEEMGEKVRKIPITVTY